MANRSVLAFRKQVAKAPMEPPAPEKAELEKCTSIFKDGIDCEGPASLADLDGDGLAEIIVVDSKTSTLRAWHGDGTGFGNPDGIIAHLGSANVIGVSVAGPDAAGGFDFFAGAWWVHRDKDGTVRTRLMVPTVPGTAVSDATVGANGPAPEAVDMECQDTIADLYGDGMAEVLIGTSDGRVYIFHTGLKYTPEWRNGRCSGGICITQAVGRWRNIEMIVRQAGCISGYSL